MNAPGAALVLGATFVRRGGVGRPLLVVVCTALVSGLLLVALTILLFGRAGAGGRRGSGSEVVSAVVWEDGTRGGVVVAAVLLCVAPLVLLRQVLRLGTAARERRLAALRLAGATMGQVRRVGAVEVALPALAGGLCGWLVFAALRAVLGARTVPGAGTGAEIARQLRLVPTSVAPSWWQVLLVAALLGLLGAAAGAASSRGLRISPLGVSRRTQGRPPRPWGLVLVLAALLGAPVLFLLTDDSTVPALDLVVLVLGLLLLAPWTAYVAGRAVARLARSAPVLIAARRLALDPRPAGRAGAAIGLIGLAGGVVGTQLVSFASLDRSTLAASSVAYYLVPTVLAAAGVLGALSLVVVALALHAAETMTDHARSTAGLGALGLSRAEVERSLRWEVGLVAVPVGLLGAWIGSGPLLLVPRWTSLAVICVVLGLILLAVRATTLITRPWVRRALDPTRLRTP